MVLVNTCGFVEKAKHDSIQTLLAAADTGAKVVAAGCMAERYGRELADSLPEAQAVLGFDDYPDISARLNAVARRRDGRRAHPARPARTAAADPGRPPRRRGVAPCRATPRRPSTSTPRRTCATVLRRRLDTGPVASLKLASGCDRRCAFCAIPAFRGAFVSRTPDELLAEAEWLAKTGVRELVLVSENSTSYGKDLGDPRALEKLLPQLAAVDGIVRVRASLPPAGRDPTRPGRGDRHHARRGALLRPVVPALQRAGAAPDAPLRLDRAVPGAAGRGPRAGAGGRRAQQLHRRLPRRDPGRRGRAGPVPDRGAARRDRRLRLQRRGRHRGRRHDRQGRRRPRSSGGTSGWRRSPTSCAPSAPRNASARPSTCWSTRSTAAWSRGARPTRRPRSTARPRWSSAGGVDLAALRPGDLVRATVTGSEGVDLVAVPAGDDLGGARRGRS